jgi:hypothetical protein
MTLRMRKNFSPIFLSYHFPAGTLSSVLKIKFLATNLCFNFTLQALFLSAQHIYEKREGSRVGSGPLTNGSGFPESPKTWGSGSRSGSPTLVDTYLYAAAGTGGGSEEVFLQHGVC